jgi:DNA integrity scanning protein DisA with diadenylate cyclase activity
MVIGSDRIVAARCTLPITGRTDIPAHFGMRHKAAIGLTEECDAHVIVVSEETGRVSYARNGEITTVNTINELFALLGSSFQQTGVSQDKRS